MTNRFHTFRKTDPAMRNSIIKRICNIINTYVIVSGPRHGGKVHNRFFFPFFSNQHQKKKQTNKKQVHLDLHQQFSDEGRLGVSSKLRVHCVRGGGLVIRRTPHVDPEPLLKDVR